jgi:hypothetical protein
MRTVESYNLTSEYFSLNSVFRATLMKGDTYKDNRILCKRTKTYLMVNYVYIL